MTTDLLLHVGPIDPIFDPAREPSYCLIHEVCDRGCGFATYEAATEPSEAPVHDRADRDVHVQAISERRPQATSSQPKDSSTSVAKPIGIDRYIGCGR